MRLFCEEMLSYRTTPLHLDLGLLAEMYFVRNLFYINVYNIGTIL
jgi:hypothetical protein